MIGKLDQPAGDLGSDLDVVGPDIGVVGARMVVDLVDGQQQHNCRGDDYADEHPAADSLAIRNFSAVSIRPP